MTNEARVNSHYDIAIVGTGIIGLTLANLLRKRAPSVQLAVVDAGAPAPLALSSIDPRVIALSKKNERLLDSIGVWNAVKNIRVCPYYEMFVWDGDGTADIHFDRRMSDQDNLGHIVENKILVDALHSSLSGIDFYFNASATDISREENYSSLVLSTGDTIEASIVIAADGANSELRTMSNIPLREWDYGHTAIVTTVQTEKPHCHTAWQRFGLEGPLAFLPLEMPGVEQNLCSIVWSISHDEATQLMALDDEAFCDALAKAFECKLGRVLRIEKRIAFPLRQRHAKKYTLLGLALVGDAAHTIHPLAGQGANIGLYDVEVLAEEIQRAVHREIPLHDESILRRYERRRQAHNLLAMSTMEGFKRVFGADDIALRWIRNEGLRTANKMPWLKQQFLKVASGN